MSRVINRLNYYNKNVSKCSTLEKHILIKRKQQYQKALDELSKNKEEHPEKIRDLKKAINQIERKLNILESEK